MSEGVPLSAIPRLRRLPPLRERHRDGARPATTIAETAPRGERAALVALALWLAATMLWRWPVFSREAFASSNSLVDMSFYVYAGEVLRTGGRPYLDFWDHKPPLVYLLHAAGLAVSGGRLWGVWLVSLASVIAALVLCHRTLRATLGPAAALLGTTWFAVSVPSIFALALTEWYVLPVSWAAVAVFARAWFDGGSTTRLGAWLGVLATLGALLKPNMIGAPVAAGLVSLALLARAGRARDAGRFVAAGLAGCAATLAPVLLWLAAIGALGAFREQVLEYNAAYVGTGPSWRLRLRALDAGLWWSTLYSSAVLPLLGWLLAVARRVRMPATSAERPLVELAIVWLPVELLFAATSGRDYSHYFMTLYPPLALLVAVAGAAIVRRLAADVDASMPRALPVVPLLALAIAAHGAWRMFWRERDDERSARRIAQLDAVVQRIEATVPSDRSIFVWGHAVDIYFLADRRPATPFVYVQPLLTPGFADSARVARFVERIREERPAVIVDGGARTAAMMRVDGVDLTPPLGRFDARWSYPRVANPAWRGAAWWAMPPAMRTFYDLVARDYVPLDTVGPERWVLYRRRTDLAAAPRPPR